MNARTVVVTGASSGIGEATARAFGLRGDRVVLVARRTDRLERLAGELPEALVVTADVTRRDEMARIVGAAVGRYGGVDVLVNNAGLGRHDWLERLPVAEIAAQIDTNLTAPILLTQAVLPTMQARSRGVIINVCSVAGKIAVPTMSIYAATKFGLTGFSEGLRRELRPQGIHVCTIYPGPVTGTEFSARRRKGGLRHARGRLFRTSTERVARAIVALADRPRPHVVIPAVFWPLVGLNAILPSLVDALIAPVARRALAAREPGEE